MLVKSLGGWRETYRFEAVSFVGIRTPLLKFRIAGVREGLKSVEEYEKRKKRERERESSVYEHGDRR
jgi:hypothetical protein